MYVISSIQKVVPSCYSVGQTGCRGTFFIPVWIPSLCFSKQISIRMMAVADLCRTGVRFYVFHFLRYKTPLPMVQWSPSHPGLHSHFPSLHCPCSAQWEWQVRSSQVGPTQPSSHWHIPLEHTPWLPQSRVHSSVEQSEPVHCGSQLQSPVSRRKVPCPEHCSWHTGSAVSQLTPPQPVEQ